MSEQADLQAIRGFLEGLKYKIEYAELGSGPHWLFTHLWEDGWLPGGDTEAKGLAAALNHYLSTQLGVHWRKARAERKNWENFLWAISLDREVEKQILQAISYIEQLEKGGLE